MQLIRTKQLKYFFTDRHATENRRLNLKGRKKSDKTLRLINSCYMLVKRVQNRKPKTCFF